MYMVDKSNQKLPMKLKELFKIRNGIVSTSVGVSSLRTTTTVAFMRPASTQARTLSGWVERNEVSKQHIYPRHTLFVSTNGEGSHTYSYVSDFEFAANSDISVLIPLRSMSLQEKLFYAKCISMNRYKFSYGRKPKGDRLRNIELPDSAPIWVDTLKDVATKSSILNGFQNISTFPLERNLSSFNIVKLKDIFSFSMGNKLDKNKMQLDSNGISFVSRGSKNNGITGRVKLLDGVLPYAPGQITVALGGSVLTSSLQQQLFYTSQNVAVLKPLDEMSVEELLYYCSSIKANAFRFNACGREANRFLRDLTVPSRNSVPDWVYGSLKRAVDDIN